MTNATTHDSLEDRVTGARPCLSGGHAGRTGMPLRAAGQGAALRPARCSLGRGAALTGPRDSLVGEEQGVTGSARDRSRLLWARVCRRGRVGLPGCPEGVSKEASASGGRATENPAGVCCPASRRPLRAPKSVGRGPQAAAVLGAGRQQQRGPLARGSDEFHSARRPQLLTGTQQVRGLAGLRPTHESRTCDAPTPAPPVPKCPGRMPVT